MTENVTGNLLQLENNYYALDPNEIFKKIHTDPTKGLSTQEAAQRLEQLGQNVIPRHKKSIWKALFAPLVNWLIAVYMMSAIAMILLGDVVRTVPTFIIVGANALVAIVQQIRAEKQLEALRKLAASSAKVIRDGQEVEIPTEQIVLGDIVKLSQGDKIPADCRIIEGRNFEVDESSLTGESEPVKKQNKGEKINAGPDLPLQDQKNMLFLGTYIAKGNGTAVVVKTGARTEIGKISIKLEESSTGDIPLRRKLNNFAKYLSFGVVIILILSIIQKIGVRLATDNLSWAIFKADLANSIDLGMKVMPINLPLLTTIVLLTGVLAMANFGVIVREISRVESLGRVSVICSDKTGTMTQNQMTVKTVWLPHYTFPVEGLGYSPEGTITLGEPQGLPGVFDAPPKTDTVANSNLNLLIQSAVLNNNASIAKAEFKTASKFNKTVERWTAKGLPTEASLITLGRKYGIEEDVLRSQYEFIFEYGFDSSLKRMSKVYKKDGTYFVYTKGATEWLMDFIGSVKIYDKILPMNEKLKKYILESMQLYAGQGFRVLSIAYREMKSLPADYENHRDQVENQLIYLGFVAILDPPRDGVREAVQQCHDAGIKVVMITGDSATTAKAIADDLTIFQEGDLVREGKDVPTMPIEDLPKVSVFARVSPEHKEIIVSNYQKEYKKIVAMTGDGVNDALALNMADAGIAMGIAGTDVAKEAADLVITDDSFATIQVGVREGRGLFMKIRNIIYFFICVSIMEAIILFGSSVILPIDSSMWGYWQLNLIYLGAHFFPPLGFTFGKNAKNIMKEKPRDSAEIITPNIFKLMVVHIVIMGLAITGTYLLALNGFPALNQTNLSGITENDMIRYIIDYSTPKPTVDTSRTAILFTNHQLKAQAMAFAVLFICESIFLPFQIRRMNESLKDSLKDMSLVEWFLYFVSIVVLIVIMYLPNMQRSIMTMDPQKSFDLAIMCLSVSDWLVCIGLSLIVLGVVEFTRALFRKRKIFF
jgi:Ca2+-transporting ATPase